MKSFKLICVILLSITKFVLAQNVADKIPALEVNLQQHPEDIKTMMELGKCYHSLAAQGEKGMVEKAESMFQQVITLQPNHADAHCWYGSVLTLKGRDAFLPFNKMRFVNDGNKEMDVAVSLDSTNISVRLTRANTSLSLPSMFNRIDFAITDFDYFVKRYEQAPQYFDKNQYGDALIKLGKAYHKKGDDDKAKSAWQKVIELMPASDFSANAQNLLKEIEG
jgi:tetratricopeptide (TPR) repeat protein